MPDPLLRSLADAARAVTAAETDRDVLNIVAAAAREVIGARKGVARRGPNGAPPGPRLVAPLMARDGSSLGLIELWDKPGDFTRDDEAIVIQLAQMAANAIETLELLQREHAARLDAEEQGRRLLREKQRAEALHRVGQAIAGRLELHEIVQLATDAARELTPAQFGAFFYNVISDAGEAYMLYTLSGVERSAFERFPMPRNTDIFAPTFTGKGIVRLDDVLADPRYGHSAPYHGMPEGHLPVRSYLAVPVITSDGEVAGGLFFGHPEPGMFSAEDEHMVVGIAAQSAIAIENARLYQERTRTAQTLQRALLPPHLPEIDGLELAATYRAAGEGNEVGGDFYDVFVQGDGSFAVVVGDVCGKGPQAAAVTALARYTLRAHAAAGLRPSYQLVRLNDAMLRQQAPGFVTAALARVELHDEAVQVELTTAGHPMPILARADGTAVAVGDVGTPLGIIERPDLPEVHMTLAPGDLLVFYTDGVSEADAPRRILTEPDLAALVAEKAADGPRAVVEHLERTAVSNAGGNPRDDIACLALRVAAPRRVSERFAARPEAAHDVADALAPLASELGERTAMDVRLLATELVANAVRHADAATVQLEVRLAPRTVHLSVSDDGRGFEAPARPIETPDGPGGWGLYLVDRCAARWGIERGERHRVWLELAR
ncbi:SpoIIE family protein phosphatase [Solirubrobacter sp. CPCC 204708]|uniref:SpoIIE family protein phosphatase n=1 Tax=Solirubrobacter deserti TaxID=2282478 RepID=A0ABT4RV93_9ACTN|nr:SpoIIE family protein phosphatase [Solirubrobacter deserti]MBE2318917.1 SpoIIE family protein phosphatase [Solirubrobacter deserti]MDA0142507.1 SpoIIE family protein phosphatase [Solirubrobacter deserti]